MDGINQNLKVELQRAVSAHGFSSANFTQFEDPDSHVREAELRRWIECNYRWIMALVRKIRRKWPILGEDEFTAGDVAGRIMQRLRNGALRPICASGGIELEARWRAYWRTVASRLARARARRKSVEASRREKYDAADGEDPLQVVALDPAKSMEALFQERRFDLEHAENLASKHLPVRQSELYRRIVQAARSGSESHREIARAVGVSHVTVGMVIAKVRTAAACERRCSA